MKKPKPNLIYGIPEDILIANINPRAKVPRGFGLWSRNMRIMWLRANQKKLTR